MLVLHFYLVVLLRGLEEANNDGKSSTTSSTESVVSSSCVGIGPGPLMS